MKELFNKKIWIIIENILNNPNQDIRVRELGKKLKISPSLISQVLKRMHKTGLLRDTQVDLENPSVRILKVLFNISMVKPIIRYLKELGEGTGIYGSWATGRNTDKSDVDLWIKVKKYPEDIKIARLRKIISEKVKSEPSLLFLTDEKIKNLKKNNPPLYFSLIHSIHLWGETLD